MKWCYLMIGNTHGFRWYKTFGFPNVHCYASLWVASNLFDVWPQTLFFLPFLPHPIFLIHGLSSALEMSSRCHHGRAIVSPSRNRLSFFSLKGGTSTKETIFLLLYWLHFHCRVFIGYYADKVSVPFVFLSQRTKIRGKKRTGLEIRGVQKSSLCNMR